MNSDLFLQNFEQPKTMSLRGYIIAILVLALGILILAVSAQAQVPRTISYQGTIVENGVPVTGEHLIHLTLYDSATGGAAVYEESQQATIANGIFDLRIGSVSPFPNAM